MCSRKCLDKNFGPKWQGSKCFGFDHSNTVVVIELHCCIAALLHCLEAPNHYQCHRTLLKWTINCLVKAMWETENFDPTLQSSKCFRFDHSAGSKWTALLNLPIFGSHSAKLHRSPLQMQPCMPPRQCVWEQSHLFTYLNTSMHTLGNTVSMFLRSKVDLAAYRICLTGSTWLTNRTYKPN